MAIQFSNVLCSVKGGYFWGRTLAPKPLPVVGILMVVICILRGIAINGSSGLSWTGRARASALPLVGVIVVDSR